MNQNTCIVITSINAPNRAMQRFAKGAAARKVKLIIIGDTKSPDGFHLDGADYYSVSQQIATLETFAALCPTNHYARKNVGYLLSKQNGASVIIDTDDDNLPYDAFWDERCVRQAARAYEAEGWLNVYKFYTEANIWPRGLPLDEISKKAISYETSLVKDTLNRFNRDGTTD